MPRCHGKQVCLTRFAFVSLCHLMLWVGIVHRACGVVIVVVVVVVQHGRLVLLVCGWSLLALPLTELCCMQSMMSPGCLCCWLVAAGIGKVLLLVPR